MPVPEDHELIEVRPDERFDAARLAERLLGKVPGAVGTPRVMQFAGGHANLTYLLRYPQVEYVLRRPPLGPVAPRSHDMQREYGVLSRLWMSFDKAPRAYFFCDDPEVIGAPFFVMERRHGIVVRGEVPAVFGGGADPQANRKLSQMVIDTLAEFHAVDPGSCGLDDLGHPAGFIHRQVEGWLARWEKAKHEENPVVDRVASWITSRVPNSPEVTLVHNDWRLDNMAAAEDDPGRCVAVYDWDMCTRGDPLADVGTLLAVWYSAGEVPATLNPMPTGTPGFLTREEATDRYAEKSGRDISTIRWYLVFGTWKLGVVLQQIYIRWKRGQTRDERFASMGEAAAHLFRLAEDRMEG